MRSSSFSRNHPYAKTRGWVSPNRAASALPTITDGVNEVDNASEIWVKGGTVSEPEEGVAQISFGGQAIGSNSAGGTGGSANSAAQSVRMFNSSGVTLIPGDVVVTDPAVDSAVTTTSTASNTRIAGVVQEPINVAEWGPVLFAGSGGYTSVINTTGTVNRGDYALTSATAKLAGATASRVAGSFGVYLTGSGDFPDFSTDSRTTEAVVPVTELEIDMPTVVPAGRVLFLALWLESGVSAVDVDGWTLIGSESGFYYYYKTTEGDDTAEATWTTASVAVATVLLLHPNVFLGDPIADHDYDTSTSAAAVSGLDTDLAYYAIAGVASEVTPGSGFTRLGGGATAAATDSLLALFNGTSDGITYYIGAAQRTDGEWSEYGSNPVISPGSSGTWDDGTVKDPCLIYDGTRYVCYYAGFDGVNYRIGRATANSHEGPWTKYAGNPVLTLGSGGAFDDEGCSFPTVLYEPADTGNEWKMWYAGYDGANHTIGYAHSTDGISWTKEGRVIDKGSSGSWNDEGLLAGAIYKNGATYNLFVGGRQGTTNPRWQGGLWTFTNPTGVYTADAGNPIMDARFNDANTTQQPTADVIAGATTVSLPTPSAFNVGEPVVLIDGLVSVDPQVFYVTAVGGGGVTLDHAATATFESTDGIFRSFAYNAVFPRSVLARSGGYEAFVTPFQPVEDVNVPGSKLFEGAFEMRASGLTGAWTYYYVAGRGLLFPLQPGAPAWRSRSAENPSVLAATGSAAGTLAGKYIGHAATATSPFTGSGNEADAIFAIPLLSEPKASALLYGPDLGGAGGSPAAETGSGAPAGAPTTSALYIDGTDLYVWDGSAWHGPYILSDAGS